nr:MAG TPA: hypothetical protein [Caudoviricetes sp.]
MTVSNPSLSEQLLPFFVMSSKPVNPAVCVTSSKKTAGEANALTDADEKIKDISNLLITFMVIPLC